MRKIEDLCARFRRGGLSENEYRLGLVRLISDPSKVPSAMLTVIAERLQYGIPDSGDG